MNGVWVSMLLLVGLVASAAETPRYEMTVKPSRYYNLSIKVNDKPVALDTFSRKAYSFDIGYRLNVEFNSVEICFEHKEGAKGLPNLRSLAKVEVTKKWQNREGEDRRQRVVRQMSPAAHKFTPGKVQCKKKYFSSLSEADLKRRYIEEKRRPANIYSVQ